MIYFTSDLHLGHKNAVALNNRPFADTDQMDAAIIKNWNSRVKSDDLVYIVGDFIWESADAAGYLDRLAGRKILITGNHDAKWLSRGDYADRFELIAPYLETMIDDVSVTLCHYPMLEWRWSRKFGSRKLGYHVYGHAHNGVRPNYQALFLLPHSFNAGVDVNGFMPVTWEELKANNRDFKLAHLPTLELKAKLLASIYHIYQTDKSGKPYIEHPTAVAAQLGSDVDKAVGYMHDIIEDTDIDPEILRRNFPPEVTDAVLAMTHEDGVEYFDYVERLSHNPIARRVKLADLTHNMDMSRLKTVTDSDLKRAEKYRKAYDILSAIRD